MDWAALLGAFLAGLVGGWSLKLIVDARRTTKLNSDNTRDIVQSGNKVGGDMAGRDIGK